MSPEQGKVLIIDDDQDTRELLGMVLRLSGFETLGVSTKQEALDMVPLLGELGIKLVLIDGNLNSANTNGEDGKEINTAIKTAWGDNIKTGGISVTNPIPEADIAMMTISNPSLFREEISSL